MLVLERGDQAYYEPKAPLFGSDVAAKFGSASYDIEEAGKCLALGRSTAGAFHAIRCLEAGILALSRCLGFRTRSRAPRGIGGAMLRLLKGQLDRRWPPNSADRLTGDGQTFDELYGALADADPYRNATMHLDRVYTEEDAKHIFDVVRGLMRRVASRCDEEGEPKA